MKNLRHSLIDYEMAMLKAIADCRAVPLTTANHGEVVNQLTQALRSPADTAIVFDDLSEPEKEALQFIVEQGGQVEAPRFTRQYGTVRPMGPARLERERPWQSPDNPTEGLWYRGLIFKAFHVTEQGGQEVVYIPTDLLPLLKPKSPPASPAKTLKVASIPAPAVPVSGHNRLRENMFSLLVYLQTTPVRLQNKTEIPPKAKQALAHHLLPPLPTDSQADELDFLLHLGQRANLLTIAHGRLKPERTATRNWLQSEPPHQLRLLQNTWRADPTWNDLWHVPGLVPQPTGWENSPLRARSKILGYLEQIDAPAGQWLSIDDFVLTIKKIDPDFQRPNGDYTTWYIKDTQGTLLMGFEHWDQIEGGLIRYVLTRILLLLGAVDVGGPTPTGAPTGFRITPQGEAFFAGRPVEAEPAQKPAYLRVDNNFYVRVPARASLYDRFQLARFASLERREENKTIYQISRASMSRAIRNGVTADQIIAFLTRVTNNQIPLKVVETLRTWSARYGTAQMEQATLLRLKNQQTVAELKQHPKLGPLLGEVIGPTTIVVATENAPEVRRLLTELGYLA